MSKIITSATVFYDAVGVRLSATYSEIEDETGRIGRIISDNKRFDRVITDSSAKANALALLKYAGENIPE